MRRVQRDFPMISDSAQKEKQTGANLVIDALELRAGIHFNSDQPNVLFIKN